MRIIDIHHIQFKRKLLLFSFITTSLSVCLVCAVFMFYDIRSIQSSMKQNIILDADMVAVASGSALVFDDPSFAKQSLKGLSANPHIVYAALSDNNNHLFVDYRFMSRETDPDIMEIQRPVIFNNNQVGTILIQTSLKELREQTRNYIAISILILFLSLLLSMLLSSRLYHSLSRSIEELVTKSRIVSEKNDYSVRAKKFRNDELGELTDAFNQMLDDFQQQEKALKQAVLDQKSAETQLRRAQKMEAIGTLAGGIAHDFNNILAAVIGYTEIAMDELKEGTEEYNALLEVMNASNRAKTLVNQILTFSRTHEHDKRPVCVQPVVKETLKLLKASLPSTIRIESTIETDDFVMSDPSQIHQVVLNLCTNAAHAMAETGGVLSVTLKNRHIDEEFCRIHPRLQVGRYVELTISDTGYGIDRQTMDMIFDPFFTTKDQGEGTGLGLSVVHGIVSDSQGVVTVYSEPGHGSTFKVYLPGFEGLDDQGSHSPQITPHGNEHVFIIDDEPQIIHIMAKHLKNLGYTVTQSTDSIKAIELFMESPEKYDLVITDLTMPGLTGDKVTEKFLDCRPDIPIIISTGFSAIMNRESALALGARDYIMKPVIKSELAQIIRRVLDSDPIQDDEL